MTAELDWRRFDTARLRLSPFAATAEERLATIKALNTPVIAQQWVDTAHPFTDSDFDQLVQNYSAANDDLHLWSVCAKNKPGSILGRVSLRLDDQGHWNLGYYLLPEHWGKGLMTEAVNAAVEFAFDVLDLAQIWSGAFFNNSRSLQLLERTGFQRHQAADRLLTPSAPASATPKTVSMFSMSADDFRHHRMRAGCHSFTTIQHRPLPIITVAAAALVNASGEILVAQRPAGKSMAGLWEFPGGKLEPGETPEAALIRELSEELGIDTDHSCLSPVAFASHSYPKFHLMMPVFAIRQWRGEITGREGQAVQWIAPRQLWDLPMPPADEPIIPLLIDLL